MKDKAPTPALIHYVTLSQRFAERLGVKKKGGWKKLRFKPGINVLVGPNGSGKSTVLTAITEYVKEFGRHQKARKDGFKPFDKLPPVKLKVDPGPFRSFDFEKENPRTKSYFEEGFTTMQFQLKARWSSHGETTRALLREIGSADSFKNACVLLDEPEQALDMEGVSLLLKAMVSCKAHQIIVATHCPALILDPKVNVIELEEGYRNKVALFIRGLVQQGT